jgi:hypothetical protein
LVFSSIKSNTIPGGTVIMRKVFLILMLYGNLDLFVLSSESRNITNITAERISNIVSVIYIVEGGNKTRFPYGIKSIKVKSTEQARRICENTVRNNYYRWTNSSKEKDYITFLAERYCPPKVDANGFKNWTNNFWKIYNNKFPSINNNKK